MPHSQRKHIRLSLKSEYLRVLIIGEPELIMDELPLLYDKDLEDLQIFAPEETESLRNFAEEMPNTTLHTGIPNDSDFEKAHIAYILTKDETEKINLIHLAKKHKIIIIDELAPSSKHKNTKEKLILNKIQSTIPGTRNYQNPYEVLEYMTTYTKMAKIRATMYLSLIGIMVFAGLFFLTIYEFELYPEVKDFLGRDHSIFYWMLLVGFLAEMVAGSMGMGYGTICTAILLFLGQSPAVASASIHSAQTFTTFAGVASHYKLRNINMKLVKALAPYAILGALMGSFSLYFIDKEYGKIMKPLLAGYTMFIGVNIFIRTLMNQRKRQNINRKRSNLPVLGLVGGFLDSFAGGGWGPLVTGSLIKDGRTPRYVVGSSIFLKFLLTTTSAITFIFTLGTQHWNIILGLLLGGVITAPFSAMLTTRLPIKKMTLAISILVIIMSAITLYKALF